MVSVEEKQAWFRIVSDLESEISHLRNSAYDKDATISSLKTQLDNETAARQRFEKKVLEAEEASKSRQHEIESWMELCTTLALSKPVFNANGSLSKSTTLSVTDSVRQLKKQDEAKSSELDSLKANAAAAAIAAKRVQNSNSNNSLYGEYDDGDDGGETLPPGFDQRNNNNDDNSNSLFGPFGGGGGSSSRSQQQQGSNSRAARLFRTGKQVAEFAAVIWSDAASRLSLALTATKVDFVVRSVIMAVGEPRWRGARYSDGAHWAGTWDSVMNAAGEAPYRPGSPQQQRNMQQQQQHQQQNFYGSSPPAQHPSSSSARNSSVGGGAGDQRQYGEEHHLYGEEDHHHQYQYQQEQHQNNNRLLGAPPGSHQQQQQQRSHHPHRFHPGDPRAHGYVGPMTQNSSSNQPPRSSSPTNWRRILDSHLNEQVPLGSNPSGTQNNRVLGGVPNSTVLVPTQQGYVQANRIISPTKMMQQQHHHQQQKRNSPPHSSASRNQSPLGASSTIRQILEKMQNERSNFARSRSNSPGMAGGGGGSDSELNNYRFVQKAIRRSQSPPLQRYDIYGDGGGNSSNSNNYYNNVPPPSNTRTINIPASLFSGNNSSNSMLRRSQSTNPRGSSYRRY